MMKSSQEPEQRVEENTPNLDGAEGPRRRLTAQYDPDHVVPVMKKHSQDIDDLISKPPWGGQCFGSTLCFEIKSS